MRTLLEHGLPLQLLWALSGLQGLALIGLSLVACQGDNLGGFGPPDLPAHDDSEEGYMHASGKSVPFLCGDEGGGRSACPEDLEPEPQDLSCDASGCHGSYDFQPDTPQDSRDLLGSDGPSCYSCHGREWSTRLQ